MRFFTKLRIQIRDFVSKHKNKVILILVAWITIVAINYFLGKWVQGDEMITTYTPHEPIIETGETVSTKNQEKIEELISQYIQYCNAKEYEKAYAMIRQECRKTVYPTLESFQNYVDYVFRTPKIYNIQNYSNKNGKYFYRIRILDDILTSGLTGEDSVKYFEDKLVLEEKNGEILLSVKEYIDSQELEKIYEDKYMKIVVTKKITMFEEEIYTLQITNRTSNVLVIADGTYDSEMTLSTQNEELIRIEDGYTNIVLQPNSKRTCEISFLNFYDEGETAEKINLKRVRVLKSYHSENKTENEQEDNTVEIYSTSIQVK